MGTTIIYSEDGNPTTEIYQTTPGELAGTKFWVGTDVVKAAQELLGALGLMELRHPEAVASARETISKDVSDMVSRLQERRFDRSTSGSGPAPG